MTLTTILATSTMFAHLRSPCLPNNAPDDSASLPGERASVIRPEGLIWRVLRAWAVRYGSTGSPGPSRVKGHTRATSWCGCEGAGALLKLRICRESGGRPWVEAP